MCYSLRGRFLLGVKIYPFTNGYFFDMIDYEHTAYWRGKGNGQSTKALITINADTSVYCKEVSNEF